MTSSTTRLRVVFAFLAAMALFALPMRAYADSDGGDSNGRGGGEGKAGGEIGDHGGGDEDETRDHDAARSAVQKGEALPLSKVISMVGSNLGGDIVEIEFEQDNGRWIYEFKVIDHSGRFREVYVDAATARIVRIRGGD
jgi:hypothetical protein